ncbi:MAG TPA: RlmE family RNA methyltransferase, partial [Herbaspirillum sp.]|nr:RlmE family RNA methyltransferase [Herbaspirillum sp.]
EAILNGRKVDLVLSDMAPNLSGVAIADAARVEHLVDLAIGFAQMHMKPTGSLLVKCFNGATYNELLRKFRSEFKTVMPKKPKASRDKSSEIFLLGRILENPQ